MPNSVFIAGAIGFVIGATTNIVAALFCGVFFAFIMWSLTGFRFVKSTESAKTPKAAPSTSRTSELSNASEIQFAPHELGVCLAIRLDTSCPMSKISPTERSLLMDSNISIEEYHRELLVLSASAQEHAVKDLLGNSDIGQQVMAGYQEAWNNFAKSGTNGAFLYDLYMRRRSAYQAAVKSDRDPQDISTIKRLPLIFAESISSRTKSPEKSGTASMLAMLTAQAYYDAHYQGAEDALKSQKFFDRTVA